MVSSQEVGDLGYNGFPVSLFYLAPIDFDHILDPNVVILFKGLLRKNAITREKRLGEFLALIENESTDHKDDRTIRCWLQTYAHVALDSSKNVRALAHRIQTTYMEGGKEFSKYLKTSIPVLLSGLFDEKTIATRTYQSLLAIFQNDKTKVDHTLWTIFLDQIAHYCHAVLVNETENSITDERSETKEDMALKYDRAVNSAIQMIIKLLDFTLLETAASEVNECLLSDQFWERLGMSSVLDTLNTQLLRSYFQLFAKVFRLKDGALSEFARSLNVKELFKTTSKKLIKNLKFADASIAYSTVVVPFWEMLRVLTEFGNLEVATNLKIKKSFWEFGGSKSFSRLKGYLKLSKQVGSFLLSPEYYREFSAFLTSLKEADIKETPEFAFLSFTSSKDARLVVQKSLIDNCPMPMGANGIELLTACVRCSINSLGLFEIEDEVTKELAEAIFWTALDTVSRARITGENVKAKKRLCVEIGEFARTNLNFDDLTKQLISTLDPNEESAIHAGGKKLLSHFGKLSSAYNGTLEDKEREFVCEVLIEKVEELYEPAELTPAFDLLGQLLDQLKGLPKSLSEWIFTLPSFVTPNFVSPPTNVLAKLLQKISPADSKELVNDFFEKVATEVPDRRADLILVINSNEVVSLSYLKESIPLAYSYLVELSKKESRGKAEDSLVFNYLDDEEILSNLLSLSGLSATSQLNFIRCLSSHSIEVSESNKVRLQELTRAAISAGEISFLEKLSDTNLARSALFDAICSEELSQEDVKMIADELLPISQLEDLVYSAIKSVDLGQLALANPLSQNIHLIQASVNHSLVPDMIAATQVIASIPKFDSAVLGLCSEYLEDFMFLSRSFPESTLDVKEKAEKKFLDANSISLDEAAVFLNGESEDGLIGELIKSISGSGPFSALQFYHARLLLRVFYKTFNRISKAEFSKLKIIPTKLANHPLKIALYVTAATDFLEDAKSFERLRNFVFGEILGVRGSADILTHGQTWVALATNFLHVERGTEIMPPHKMGMLINQLLSWLDSEVAYDQEFNNVRSTVAVFCSRLLEVTVGLPDKFWELAVELCTSNLACAQTEPLQLELRYTTAKLAATLAKHANSDAVPNWEESKAEISNELFAVFADKAIRAHDEALSNHAVRLWNQLISRVIPKFALSNSGLGASIERLYDVLMDSTSLELQRALVSLLMTGIDAEKEEFVVNYELKKSKLSDEESNNVANLPSKLFTIINSTSEHLEVLIEEEKFLQVSRYLWGWALVMEYFRDSSFSIRSDYIAELKEAGVIVGLLNNFAHVADIGENAFLKKLRKLGHDSSQDLNEKVSPRDSLVEEYNIAKGCPGEPIAFEMKFALVNLYFRATEFFGSTVQTWFTEVRDLQLKQTIEKFTIRYISPRLILRILESVEEAKNRLVARDENLTIKISKVSNEIRSIYVIDEQTMEMVVKIPENFPLANVLVDGPVRLGVKETQWKAWLLASQRVVSLTNGSIVDAIELFNRNVNLHFSGFEECAICYSILHQDHSLPSKVCPTCLNKFHAACLYKWFKSSNSSTCPLCRSAFNFKVTRG